MCILITFDIRIKLSLWMNWVVFLPFLLWMSFDTEAIIKFSTFSWLTSSDWWNFIHDQNMMTISVSVVHRIKKISSKSLVVLVLPFQYMDPFSMRLMKMLNLGISLFSRTGVLLLWPSMWMYGRSENQCCLSFFSLWKFTTQVLTTISPLIPSRIWLMCFILL